LMCVVCDELLITQAKVDYLKKHAKYEVVDYEDNIFKGWTVEEAKEMLSGQYPEDKKLDIPIYEGFNGALPVDLDWRVARPECISPVKSQTGCNSHWAFTVAHMISERVCAPITSNSAVYKDLVRPSCLHRNLFHVIEKVATVDAVEVKDL